mmetsp:Transcript_11117/g.23564  ORF Transcript_11117/g.23564 Transcript_11117/m.23564 type:complete len:295 (-) Transcript_11117:206-1090(-)|eukprot:CAMPEP_0201233214 /NCGR_PEP_ID=MMETSP0852-20130820/5062_1 /ASSEMBLY_ACC=CAM_ASM_000632 /TAXON_ID=183588 /ORGANISM="Pseudo-nitzschia fraudulenta, Strain WWA7" /LENGTH=294 /DNA_ID=CAMNT_0047525993 /DNA_START=89 /DNA_END=973 /DNA_ORIENTATION=+
MSSMNNSFHSNSSSMSGSGQPKRRITKTEKIAELQGRIKILQDENQRLGGSSKGGLSSKLDRDSSHTTQSDDGGSKGCRSINGKELEKLTEALRTLKRVTVKQGVSLATLRQKSNQRRYEITQKDKLIRSLEHENKAFRKAHENMKSNEDNDVSALRSQLADLELKLAKEENTKAEQDLKLKERDAGISSLKAMLSDAKGRKAQRGVSSADSFGGGASYMSDSTSGDDVAKLKKELAKKAEKICNLQQELEICKDEIHDLKQRNQFINAFPNSPAPGELDFFEDGEDDDFWGGF